MGVKQFRGTGRRGLVRGLAAVVFVVGAGLPRAVASDDAIRLAPGRPMVIEGVRTSKKVVALTFDDGPDPRWTPAILAALDRYHAHATFFMEGQFVDRWPDLARQVVAHGNEVGNHTYSHPDLRALDTVHVTAQAMQTTAAFQRAGLPRPFYFRPPKGLLDAKAEAGVANAGLLIVEWTPGLCIEKWARGHTPEEAVAPMLARLGPGEIILGHDGGIPNRARTVAAVPLLLARLRARGYRVVSIGELLKLTGATS
ncbi:MAG: peptidoglycan-N-acetylglucosamine deacetylase [Acidimicrobiaceae bacterium]|nr:peptidoglycan-N-acetylglucosamine deacetylase [Acidimicrobiaceae bacterium]